MFVYKILQTPIFPHKIIHTTVNIFAEHQSLRFEYKIRYILSGIRSFPLYVL